MKTTETGAAGVGGRIPLLRLTGTAGVWLAAPTSGAAAESAIAFPSFILPRVPHSLVNWLTIGAANVWKERQRCLAALLLIHCRTGRWTLRLPWQRCGPRAACWTSRADGVGGLSPDHRVGGTFQVVDAAACEDPRALLPAADGVHLVLHAGSARGVETFYVRAGGQVQVVRRDHVIENDYQSAWERAMPRLRLA